MLANLFSENHKEIYKVAKRITNRRDYKLAGDLVNETYLHLNIKQVPVPPNGDEFIKWFCKTMKNLYIWPNSNFNKSFKIQAIDNEIDIIDSSAFNQINISVEETNEATKELISVSSSMPKDRMLKYIHLLEFKNSLPLHERYLFEIYYEKGLSCRDISKMESQISGQEINYQSINIMVNSIKKKLKEWKQSNLLV